MAIFCDAPEATGSAGSGCIVDPLRGRVGSLGELLTALLPFIYALAAMVALLFLVWGGIRYLTSRGDEKQLTAARGTITSAIIGLLIILLVGVIAGIIATIFKIDLFGSLVPAAYAADTVDIGCAVKMAGGVCIKDAFPNVGSLFTTVVKAALFTAAFIFLAMTIWGGFRFINAGGNKDEVDAARGALSTAVIGVLIVAFSLALIEVITNFAGVASIF